MIIVIIVVMGVNWIVRVMKGSMVYMTEITVRDLASYLLDLIEIGCGDKKVRVSVIYDNCEHIQELQGVYCFDEINWITLVGGTKLTEENIELKMKIQKVEEIINNRLSNNFRPVWDDGKTELFIEEKVGYKRALKQLKKKLIKENIIVEDLE